MRAKNEETQEIITDEIKNNPKVTFEKFKKWVKENALGISGVFIGVGGIIAVVATSLRTSVKAATEGTYKFGKGIAKVSSKLGPVFSALGSVLMTLLNIGSKALMWLSNNLWFLLVALVFFLWNIYGKKVTQRVTRRVKKK